jgi:NAD(P)-dependent dehydrogenase (short-subunit alcohol dehydrogenase family)
MRRLLHLFSVFVMAGFTALAHAEIPAKVVLITGSASGIGKALAEQLLAAEHIVYGADIEVTGNGYLTELGGTPLVMDVTEDHQVRAGVDKIIREQGRIDVLVNNAGIGAIGPIEDLSDAQVLEQFDVNVFGYGRLQRAVLPHMRAAGKGRIVVVSSLLGVISVPALGWYSASKHAVEAMADTLAMEVKPQGIDVVIIRPGATATNFSDASMVRYQQVEVSDVYKPMMQSYIDSRDSQRQRAQSPQEVAAVIVEAIAAVDPKPAYQTSEAVQRALDSDGRR